MDTGSWVGSSGASEALAYPLLAEVIAGSRELSPELRQLPVELVLPVRVELSDGIISIRNDQKGHRHPVPHWAKPSLLWIYYPAALWLLLNFMFYLRGLVFQFSGESGSDSSLLVYSFVLWALLALPASLFAAFGVARALKANFRYDIPWDSAKPIWLGDHNCEVLAIKPRSKSGKHILLLLPAKAQRVHDWPRVPVLPMSGILNIWFFYTASENFAALGTNYWFFWWLSNLISPAVLLVGADLILRLPNPALQAAGALGLLVLLSALVSNTHPGWSEISKRNKDAQTARSIREWVWQRSV